MIDLIQLPNRMPTLPGEASIVWRWISQGSKCYLEVTGLPGLPPLPVRFEFDAEQTKKLCCDGIYEAVKAGEELKGGPTTSRD